jgi:hypothetical protein
VPRNLATSVRQRLVIIQRGALNRTMRQYSAV